MAKCPNCGASESLQRSTFMFGTEQEFSFTFCTLCPYNAEDGPRLRGI